MGNMRRCKNVMGETVAKGIVSEYQGIKFGQERSKEERPKMIWTYRSRKQPGRGEFVRSGRSGEGDARGKYIPEESFS